MTEYNHELGHNLGMNHTPSGPMYKTLGQLHCETMKTLRKYSHAKGVGDMTATEPSLESQIEFLQRLYLAFGRACATSKEEGGEESLSPVFRYLMSHLMSSIKLLKSLKAKGTP